MLFAKKVLTISATPPNNSVIRPPSIGIACGGGGGGCPNEFSTGIKIKARMIKSVKNNFFIVCVLKFALKQICKNIKKNLKN